MSDPNSIQRVIDWFLNLLGRVSPEPAGTVQPQEQVPGVPLVRRVCLVNFNPTVASQGGKTLTQVLGWNDVDRLTNDFISDLRQVSHDYVDYQVVERIQADRFPVKEDGFAYTADEYLRLWRAQAGFHQPDAVNYRQVIDTFDLSGKVRRGQVDEVWTFSFPYAGFYESRMVGPGAFWCNSPALPNTSEAGKRYIIMAFNYQRGVGEMLESYAHRCESIMEQVYRGIPAVHEHNLWKRFIRYNKTHPGKAEVGTVHYAPNSLTDYDWGNPTPVLTTCRNWSKFPDLSGAPQVLNCQEWGNGDIREHHRWWLNLLPYIPGKTNTISNNWWEYIVDPNRVI